MDRNLCAAILSLWTCVALRKESVDRNCEEAFFLRKITMSLSARRAWIEIWITATSPGMPPSLSARRAWIEIRWGMQRPAGGAVALRKESVDRNL